MSSYLKIIILPATVITGFLLLWFFVKPIYDETRTLNQIKKPQLEALLSQENDLQQRTERISDDEENAGQAEKILNALPENAETKSLITQFEFIANKENMNLSAISLQDRSSDEQLSNGIFGQTIKAYREINGTIELRGGYGQFKQFMKDIKKIDRLVNIKQISITSTTGEEGGAIGKYSISFTAYWQPALTSLEVRNGLESQEFNQANTPADTAMPGAPSVPQTSTGVINP